MKDTNKEVSRFLNNHIEANSKMPTVLKALNKLERIGMYVEDVSDESGYPNFHIRTEEGMVRVYKSPRTGFHVQCWERAEFRYSGIPTFFG